MLRAGGAEGQGGGSAGMGEHWVVSSYTFPDDEKEESKVDVVFGEQQGRNGRSSYMRVCFFWVWCSRCKVGSVNIRRYMLPRCLMFWHTLNEGGVESRGKLGQTCIFDIAI